MDSSVLTLTEVDVGPLRVTRFAVLVITSVKQVCVLYILYVNINYSFEKAYLRYGVLQ